MVVAAAISIEEGEVRCWSEMTIKHGHDETGNNQHQPGDKQTLATPRGNSLLFAAGGKMGHRPLRVPLAREIE